MKKFFTTVVMVLSFLVVTGCGTPPRATAVLEDLDFGEVTFYQVIAPSVTNPQAVIQKEKPIKTCKGWNFGDVRKYSDTGPEGICTNYVTQPHPLFGWAAPQQVCIEYTRVVKWQCIMPLGN